MSLEQERLRVLLLDHRAMLFGYVSSIVREPHLAEDVLQNVALLVLKKGSQVGSESEFASWVRGVARLEALTALRKRRNAPQPLSDSVLDLLEDHWREEDDAVSQSTAEALRACLSELSPRAQRLVALRFANNLRGNELAQKLGQPVNTVYVAMTRIYRTLSTCIRHRLELERLDDV
jgi:RNA polymerase sigma-70 factor (ECF subfamily)